MKSIIVFRAFITFWISVTLAVEISNREDAYRENIRKLSHANNELAFNLYRRLISGTSQNVFFSPLSISTLFGMLFYGTRGNAAEELRQVLGYERADLPSDIVHNTFSIYLKNVIQHDDNSSDRHVLNIANAVLADKSIGLLEEYRCNIRKLYRAFVKNVDFKRESPRIVEEINEYVRENTNGMINKTIDELDSSTVFILLNAVYFKGTWETRFEPGNTRDGMFYNNGMESEGRIVPRMFLTSRFPYASVDNFQALELPYIGENASMLILLPKQRDGLQDLEESLTPERLVEVHRRLHRTKVKVLLPKFKLQFEKELSPEIQTLGANRIFRNGAADFSGMTSRTNLSVSEVVHKAVIEVTEEGSKAAAVTRTSRARSKHIYPQFSADHPFLFAIIESGSNCNMILFMGRVNRL